MHTPIQLGNLEIVPVREHLDLAAPSVAAYITALDSDHLSIAEIDPTVSDTAAFCERYKINSDQAANCVIIETRGEAGRQLVACVVLATGKVDVNGIVRRTIGAQKASFAPMEDAVRESGMEFGAITPVGLPEGWPILIDAAAAASEYVIIGSGIRKSKLVVPGVFLSSLPNARIIEGLGRIK